MKWETMHDWKSVIKTGQEEQVVRRAAALSYRVSHCPRGVPV